MAAVAAEVVVVDGRPNADPLGPQAVVFWMGEERSDSLEAEAKSAGEGRIG